jgi:hypothetical protein
MFRSRIAPILIGKAFHFPKFPAEILSPISLPGVVTESVAKPRQEQDHPTSNPRLSSSYPQVLTLDGG